MTEEMQQQHIVSLTASNVKILKAIHISPSGEPVFLSGPNEAGKSTVLDSLDMALKGAKHIPEHAVRTGQKEAVIIIETEDFVITREITEKGKTNVVVRAKADKSKVPTPQTFLDELIGSKQAIDPSAFALMDGKKQLELLRNVFDCDTSELDEKRARAYSKRTDVNRDVSKLEARIGAIPEAPEGLPDEEVSSGELLEKIEEAQKANTVLSNAAANIEVLQKNIDDTTAKIVALKAQSNAFSSEMEGEKKVLESNEEIDIIPLREQLGKLEETNAAIRQEKQAVEIEGQMDKLEAEAKVLTSEIEVVDDTKKKMMASVEWPLEGLSFGDDCVLYNDLPIKDNASQEEQIRISTAIELMRNPKLKLLLIRQGSLLDEKHTQMVIEMAQEAGCSDIWIEKVGKADDSALVIEDGSIVKEKK